MQQAGARVLREDDQHDMSREAVLLQWERKIEAAERSPGGSELLDSEGRDRRGAAADRGRHASRAAPLRAPGRVACDRPVAAEPERRTITITGQPTPARRRRPLMDAPMAQPDRIALWAFLLGLLLVAVAAGTAHA